VIHCAHNSRSRSEGRMTSATFVWMLNVRFGRRWLWPVASFRLHCRINRQSEPPASAGSLLDLFIDPEDGGDMFNRNVGLPELHGVTSQKTVLFKRRFSFWNVVLWGNLRRWTLFKTTATVAIANHRYKLLVFFVGWDLSPVRSLLQDP
jgi:hypothetical protein